MTGNVLDSESKELVYSLQLDNKRLFAEVKELREKIESSEINEEFFRNNDEKVKYYMGLPNTNLLLIVIQFVEPYLATHYHCTLSAFQRVTTTLMRLRLGLSGQDLAYQFGVHFSTVSHIFTTAMDILYE